MELVARPTRELDQRLPACDLPTVREFDGEVEILAKADLLDLGPHRAEQLGDTAIEEFRPSPVSVEGHLTKGVGGQIEASLESLGTQECPRHAFALQLLLQSFGLKMMGLVLDRRTQRDASLGHLVELPVQSRNLTFELAERALLACGRGTRLGGHAPRRR